jgi:hypothetical protein
MSAILSFALLFAAASQSDATPPVKSCESPKGDSPISVGTKIGTVPTGRELEQAAHAALRRWAQPAKKDVEPAARQYLALYNDLGRDTVLAKSTRQELMGKLRFRLAALAKKLRKQAAAERATAAKGKTADQPDSIDAGKKGVLAQQAGPPAGAPGGRPATGGRPARDAGEELADLIESTISPSTWARNGGQGDIYYWRPGMALVILAPQGVHEDVGRLVGQMH